MSTDKKLVVIKKDISTKVLDQINVFQQSGQLKIPKDYSPENALKSAYLILSETKNKDGQFALTHCTTESIAEALLKMVVWGLSPLKKQCAFIMYGNKLDCALEYAGNIVLAKRYGNLKSIKANAIFEKDEFTFEVDPATGLKRITNHAQTLESIGSPIIKGAYAVTELKDGTLDVEIMNITQIKAAWNQGAMKGNSPAHRNFPDQMCIKTVINRACKLLIRGSNDIILYDKQDKTIDVVHEDVAYEIESESNKIEIGFDKVEEITEIKEFVDPETGGIIKEKKSNPGF